MISWEEFKKVDIRVGTVIEVKNFPEALKPAWQLTIDFGDVLGIKKSSAQITDLYSKEDLMGKQIVAVVNFPVKQIANFFSECLVLGISNPEGHIVLLEPNSLVNNGEKVK